MTYKEEQEYNRLSSSEKKEYNRAKEDHPNWSHEQYMAKAKIIGNIDVNIDKGKDVNKPEILSEILQKTKDWLKRFTDIGTSIILAIDSAIESLKRGVCNAIESVLDWIFG